MHINNPSRRNQIPPEELNCDRNEKFGIKSCSCNNEILLVQKKEFPEKLIFHPCCSHVKNFSLFIPEPMSIHEKRDIIIKLCCCVNSRSHRPGLTCGREIWWTVSRNFTVLFLSHDIKNTKFNQYLPVDLTSLNVSNSRFLKPVMFWRWRHHGVALWPTVSPAAADSPREIWWTVSRNFTVLFLSHDIKKIQNSINIYPWIWRRLTCPTQDFWNP